MVYAQPADLIVWTQEDVPPAQAEEVLAAAEGSIEEHCGWHIAPVREDTLRVDAAPVVHLPTLRLVAVATVTLAGVPLALADYTWTTAGRLTLRVPVRAGDVLEVTYSHGLEEVPRAVRSIALAAAARAIASPHGQVNGAEGGVSEGFSRGGFGVGSALGARLSDLEERALSRYVLRVSR